MSDPIIVDGAVICANQTQAEWVRQTMPENILPLVPGDSTMGLRLGRAVVLPGVAGLCRMSDISRFNDWIECQLITRLKPGGRLVFLSEGSALSPLDFA